MPLLLKAVVALWCLPLQVLAITTALKSCPGSFRPVVLFHADPPASPLSGDFADPFTLATTDAPLALTLGFNQRISESPFGKQMNFTVRDITDVNNITVAFSTPVRSPAISSYSPRVDIVTTVSLATPGKHFHAHLPAGAYLASRGPQAGLVECGSQEVSWNFVTQEKIGFLSKVPPTPGFPERVQPVLAAISSDTVERVVANISNQFYNRFFDSETGRAAAKQLLSTMEGVLAGKPNTSAELFAHPFRMPSGIYGFGAPMNSNPVVIIVGAHLDSIDRQNWTVNVESGRAPGADDDGSGVGLLVAFAAALVRTDFQLPSGVRLELHLYSGEEEGLYGSALVASSYARKKVRVAGMMMIDQAGWVRNAKKPLAAYFTDNTDPALNRLVVACAQKYVPEIPLIKSNEDHRADSDFHSWHRWGFRAAYVAEGPVDDIVYGNAKHTSTDTIDGVDFAHAMKIGKIVFSTILELALAQ